MTFVGKFCILIVLTKFVNGNGDTMKMQPKYVLRRRVTFAIAVVFAVGALVGLYEIVSNLWWVGNGYCWGDLDKCYPVGGER